MKTKPALFLSLFFPLLFSACSSNDEPQVPMEDKRTVLIYMAADNTLDHFAWEDVEEMERGWAQMTDTEGKHLLIYVDDGDASPQLIELLKDKTGQVTATAVKEYAERNSVGTAEMQEVFRDVFDNPKYQAGSYGLVYWSHGEGWIPNPLPSTRWIGQDTGDGTHYMNIDALAEVLETAPRFDFILFDACFMQSIEVAYALRSHTDYYIGSPAENPGPGAPYDKILPHMFQKGAAAQIAAAYFNYYNDRYNEGIGISNSNWTGGTAVSVLRTSQLDNLASATRTALSGATADGAALREVIFDCDRRSTTSSSYVGYFDFVELIETMVDDPSALAAWRRAFDAAQAYWSTTPMIYSMFGMFPMERSHGVTHYIPSEKDHAEAAKAYRGMAWYEAAGLSAVGW